MKGMKRTEVHELVRDTIVLPNGVSICFQREDLHGCVTHRRPHPRARIGLSRRLAVATHRETQPATGGGFDLTRMVVDALWRLTASVLALKTPMSAKQSIANQLQEFELELIAPAIRKTERVAELLDDAFVEIGCSGRSYSKCEVIAALKAESEVHLVVTKFHVRLLTPQVALVTYRTATQSEPKVCALRSSVWQCVDERWLMVFHQGTVMAEL